MRRWVWMCGLLACTSQVVALGSSCSGALGNGSAVSGDPYWMQTIPRSGSSAFNANPGSYKVHALQLALTSPKH
ncbi:hypothetical protein PHLCEN_2v3253 [Hermanssonia centrifuga]|uniref:Uncharacterized protein n=1 Tax=Hermanssonia centrifuga TaxID=98765 RepID=A0A2R6QXK1_9APHY|nr:hypothetical protein PHLCEN_2v3253 [Hermanssonia centrifuga]